MLLKFLFYCFYNIGLNFFPIHLQGEQGIPGFTGAPGIPVSSFIHK